MVSKWITKVEDGAVKANWYRRHCNILKASPRPFQETCPRKSRGTLKDSSSGLPSALLPDLFIKKSSCIFQYSSSCFQNAWFNSNPFIDMVNNQYISQYNLQIIQEQAWAPSVTLVHPWKNQDINIFKGKLPILDMEDLVQKLYFTNVRLDYWFGTWDPLI